MGIAGDVNAIDAASSLGGTVEENNRRVLVGAEAESGVCSLAFGTHHVKFNLAAHAHEPR